MGAVFDPDDVAKDHRRIIQNAVKDLSPETKERIVKIFESWKGRASEKELEEILGGQKAKKFRELVDNPVKAADELSSNQVNTLRRMFRESFTFD